MKIFQLMSEEIFDFSADQMTSAKAHHLKQQFCGEFKIVYELCQLVMSKSQNPQLLLATLETLLRFLNWIPVGYIFETQLIENLTSTFLNNSTYQNVTLKCLAEIAGVTLPNQNPKSQLYDEKMRLMFYNSLKCLSDAVPLNLDLCTVYANGTDEQQKFIANLAIFLTTLFKEHADLVEVTDNEEMRQAHKLSIQYLLKISEVDDVEIFKICLEYWNWLASELYRENSTMTISVCCEG
jgi:exportin-1